ncbi:porin [Vibrio metschnikovii]|uniref:porin n=1 Tax=Vibrio metschnikovii TaxID=28172 RepID=UPI002FC8DF75
MKKTLVALLVASAATSVNAAEIYKSDDVSVNFYGQLRQHIEFTDKKNTDPKINPSSSRLGLDISYKAAEGFDIIGKFEFGVGNTKEATNDRDHDLHVRQHYIGMKSDYGVMTFGKRAPLADDIWGAEYSYFYGEDPYSFLKRSNFWQNNAIQYQFELDNSWVKAQYNLSENDTAAELIELYVGTSFDALSLHTGASFLEDKTSAQDVEKTYYEVTAEYALSNGTIGFTYAYNKSEDNKAKTSTKSDGYHLGGKLGVANKTSIYGGLQYIDTDADVKNLYLGVEYMFAKWARTYVEYGFNDTDNTKNENKFGIGARVYW